MRKIPSIFIAFILISILFSCSTTRKKSEVKGLKKLYHNTTAKFNGYFNAEELMDQGVVRLQSMHQDNYNTILDVYDYVDVEGATSINADMDKAIEKLTKVATIHDVSNYLDDCYVLIGKAQYLKQDYAAAIETFQYFEEEFDPKNPYGRVYKANNKKKSSKDKRKEIAQARKEKDKEREKENKEREKARKESRKEKDELNKQRKREAKDRKKSRGKTSRSSKTRNKRKSDEEKAAEKALEEAAKKAKEDQEKNKATAETRAKEIEEELKRKKEEEEKKKDEEKKYEREGEGAIWKNKTAYTFGLYWLARTYIEQQRYGTAEYVIDKLESTAGLSEDIAKQLPAAKAHLYLKRKEYTLALVELETAINKEKNRKKKARYAFIKAQIYEQGGNSAMAFEEYGRAKKFSPEHEMELNAKINEIKLAYSQGQNTRESVLSKLEKLLSEKKNERFKDQVLFAIAQVKLDGGDIDGAIEDFESAIQASSGNKNIELEANYKLGNLLFERGLYSEAKTKYDAVLSLMSKQDERVRQVENLSSNLTAIARNIEIIELQDSLLALSSKSESELREIALEQLKERDADLAASASKNNQTKNSNILRSNVAIGAARSNFFAYNPVALNQGKIDFQRVWGDRALGDNWRRSLRSDITGSFDDEIIEQEPEEKTYSDKEIDDILRSVPRSSAQKESANAKISESLFELGTLFRDRIRDYSKSIEVLERLNSEYPNFAKRDEALFYLYLSYNDLPDNAKAIKVLEMMRSEYPDSKFTKIATDPNYAKSLKDSEETIATYYDKTYDLFEQGNYAEVITRNSTRTELFPGNKEFAGKFALLNAMSLGSTEGKERYIKELQQVIRAFPKSNEEKRAQEILRFLKGDQQAFNEILYDEAEDAFEVEDDKLHYVFVITYDLGQKDFDKYKLDISNYNKKYHRFENLKLSNIYLNVEEKSQIILVRSFEDKEKAMKYYRGAEKNKAEYITATDAGFDIFVSTQKNYREVIKQRSANAYRVFFDKSYLKKK